MRASKRTRHHRANRQNGAAHGNKTRQPRNNKTRQPRHSETRQPNNSKAHAPLRTGILKESMRVQYLLYQYRLFSLDWQRFFQLTLPLPGSAFTRPHEQFQDKPAKAQAQFIQTACAQVSGLAKPVKGHTVQGVACPPQSNKLCRTAVFTPQGAVPVRG